MIGSMTFLEDRYPIAVDSDGKQLLALQLGDQDRQVRIQALFSHPLDAGCSPDTSLDWGAFLPPLQQLKKDRTFSGRRVVIHLPLEKILCFPVDISLKKGQVPDEAILEEAEKSLPYPVEEAVIDYPSIYETDSEHRRTAIITVARRADILELTDVVKQAGFLTDAVDISPMSLVRVHHFLYNPSETPYLICHIGRNQSSLQVVNQSRIYALSKFFWGRDRLVDKLNQTLKLADSGTDALFLLENCGISDTKNLSKEGKILRTVSRIIIPGLEELVFEFQKILGYARSKQQFYKIDHIYFYGLASTIKGLRPFIERRLNIPTLQGDLNNKIRMSENAMPVNAAQNALFYPALGLAMRKIHWL